VRPDRYGEKKKKLRAQAGPRRKEWGAGDRRKDSGPDCSNDGEGNRATEKGAGDRLPEAGKDGLSAECFEKGGEKKKVASGSAKNVRSRSNHEYLNKKRSGDHALRRGGSG